LANSQDFIAIVGSRNATHYGLRTAEQIGRDLASLGFGVVSGLARGIDSAAHWGCLRGKGFTAAVLGTGIDVIYPASNKRLFDMILEHGALISEFPAGTHPDPRNFPIRNRIISGLSKGVVVVEATKRSGSLITAGMALEQGRDVFAVPGSIDSFKSTGTHLLIKQGAKLVEHADDIVEELGAPSANGLEAPGFRETASSHSNLEGPEKDIYDLIGDYPLHIDQIVRTLQMAPGEVLGFLMTMELSRTRLSTSYKPGTSRDRRQGKCLRKRKLNRQLRPVASSS
jgi:DNA processing protein